jgi:cytochrome c-type biogenesis protein CcmE
VIRLAENTDFGIYGIDENEQYFFTPEQIKSIEGNNEYNQVKSLIIENFKGHFNILKYGY